MPVITEAHVVLIKSHKPGSLESDDMNDNQSTPWEDYLVRQNKYKPQRFQVHLVVSGFTEREEARGFAENFMSYGSIFVFGDKKKALSRLEVESESRGA